MTTEAFRAPADRVRPLLVRVADLEVRVARLEAGGPQDAPAAAAVAGMLCLRCLRVAVPGGPYCHGCHRVTDGLALTLPAVRLRAAQGW